MKYEIKNQPFTVLTLHMEQGESKVDIPSSADYAQPEKVVEQAALKQILLEALELLTEKEKKVILLYYYEELTLKE